MIVSFPDLSVLFVFYCNHYNTNFLICHYTDNIIYKTACVSLLSYYFCYEYVICLQELIHIPAVTDRHYFCEFPCPCILCRFFPYLVEFSVEKFME